MATIPTRLITAIEALKTQLETDIAGSSVHVLLRDDDPVKLLEPSVWPTTSRTLIALLVGGELAMVDEDSRARGTQQRYHRAALELRGYVFDPVLTNAWKTFLNTRRSVLNAIETVRQTYEFGSNGWSVDWQPAAKGLAEVPAPYAGFTVPFEVQIHE